MVSRSEILKMRYQPFSDIYTLEEFTSIVDEFSKYEDIDKKTIPFMVGTILKTCNRLGFNDYIYSGIIFVLITSVIELLTMRVRYLPFYKWYEKNLEKAKNMECIDSWRCYISIHGITNRYKQFYHSLDKDVKINLLIKIKKRYGDKTYAPFCFVNKKSCFHNAYNCKAINDLYNCPAYNEKKKLNIGIEAFATHLYQLRSKFVHESEIPSFSNKEVLQNFLMEQHKNDYARINIAQDIQFYALSKNDKLIWYHSNLEVKELYRILMNNLNKLFYEYLQEVKF